MNRRMSPQQVERQLGMQYAKMLQETNNGHYGSVHSDCEDISRYLALMSAANQAAIGMQNRRVAGAFV